MQALLGVDREEYEVIKKRKSFRRLKIIVLVVGAQARDESGLMRGGEDVFRPENEEFKLRRRFGYEHCF